MIAQNQSASGNACSFIANVTEVTRRCFDRSSDWIATFRSVFRFRCIRESQGLGYSAPKEIRAPTARAHQAKSSGRRTSSYRQLEAQRRKRLLDTYRPAPDLESIEISLRLGLIGS